MNKQSSAVFLCVSVDRPRWLAVAIAAVAYAAGVAAVSLLAATLAHAASIPAWLDDAISVSNQKHPSNQIQFVDIKDSYVWYTIQDTPEIGHLDIRSRIYELVEAHGYNMTEMEELVTTGKPPSPNRPYDEKKCWTRNFTLDIEAGRQRLLTTLVCEDDAYWFAGFRIVG